MKKTKGFTLVELIVVIAVIGVLAAILVPSMLGYVKKAKVTAANSAAKEMHNAVTVALVDMGSKPDVVIVPDRVSTAHYTWAAPSGVNDPVEKMLYEKILESFDKVNTLEEASFYVKDMSCVAVMCVSHGGTYRGGYPHLASVDMADSFSLDDAYTG